MMRFFFLIIWHHYLLFPWIKAKQIPFVTCVINSFVVARMKKLLFQGY